MNGGEMGYDHLWDRYYVHTPSVFRMYMILQPQSHPVPFTIR